MLLRKRLESIQRNLNCTKTLPERRDFTEYLTFSKRIDQSSTGTLNHLLLACVEEELGITDIISNTPDSRLIVKPSAFWRKLKDGLQNGTIVDGLKINCFYKDNVKFSSKYGKDKLGETGSSCNFFVQADVVLDKNYKFKNKPVELYIDSYYFLIDYYIQIIFENEIVYFALVSQAETTSRRDIKTRIAMDLGIPIISSFSEKRYIICASRLVKVVGRLTVNHMQFVIDQDQIYNKI